MSNPDIKTPVKLPFSINWNKVFIISASMLGLSLVVALLFRSRTLIRIIEVLDIGVILTLLAIATYALIQNSKSK